MVVGASIIDSVQYGMLVPVRTSINLRRRREKKSIMYQLEVDVDKLNAVKVVVS